jgi:prefoldin subunit 5
LRRLSTVTRASELARQQLELVKARREKLDEFAAELEQKLAALAERRRELER